MLSQINRFHGHGSVRRAYRTGTPVRGGAMSLHVVKGEHVKKTHVAVVVSRKIHKSAVKRNRIRRRIYEIMRRRIDSWRTPCEVVVTIYQPDIIHMPSPELEKTIDDLLRRAHISQK